MEKKGILYMHWAEQLAVVLLLLGFFFQLTTIGSTVLSYIVIFLWGMMFGRMWYKLRKSNRFPLFMIMVAFLVGYIVAALITGYGYWLWLIVSFIVGTIASQRLHSKRLIRGLDF
jgi:hypothetical protein